MKIGAIFFDSANSSLGTTGDSSALGSGWASIAGSSPVRVQSIHDLPTDTIWLTNLTYSSLCQSKLNEHPNFRSDAWLKTPVKQLVAELGVDCGRNPVDTACVVISTLAHRVVDVSNVNYGVSPRSQSLVSDFAEAIKANWLLKGIIPLLSWSIRNKAKKRGITYSFLFMQPNGQQLSEISKLVESGKINPIVDKTYELSEIKDAFQYVNTGRAKGKVVLKIIE